jgi:hypothetical protein
LFAALPLFEWLLLAKVQREIRDGEEDGDGEGDRWREGETEIAKGSWKMTCMGVKRKMNIDSHGPRLRT